MFDGIGGSIQRVRPNLGSIDPTLDACCQREVRRTRPLHWIYTYMFVCFSS